MYKRQVQAGARHMLRAGAGSIVCISSVTARAGIPRGLPSVSYTHLRAHETVLDIVCLLLLEKKTYTKKKKKKRGEIARQQHTIYQQSTNVHYENCK